MNQLTYNEFLNNHKIGKLSFYYKEILADLDTPLSYYMKMKYAYPQGPSFLLESVEQKERAGRFSFIGFEPYLIFKSKDNKVFLNGLIEDEIEVENPFLVLKEIMKRFQNCDLPEKMPSIVGATGYVGYDMVRFFEKLPNLRNRTIDVYDMYFIFPAKLVIFDNYTRRITLVCVKIGWSHGKEEKDSLDELKLILRFPMPFTKKANFSIRSVKNTLTKEEFEEIVEAGKRYVHAGDVVQVVLSQRFTIEVDVESLSLYRALRVINPSPYMFLLEYPEYSLVGSSPETMVKLHRDEIEVKPIAGTRPRGKTEEEDKRLAEELISDEKELAEHVMLVDLGRNDVGRVARAGTICLPEFMSIERYSHVMHIVSSVRGKIKDGLDAFDVFSACFPAGTVTGAPKIRAMEIIEELEREKREFYAGATGYFAYNGDMDFCITIRTLLKKGNFLHVQAGAGIVADSIPEKEYYETLSKAEAIIKSIKDLKEIIE